MEYQKQTDLSEQESQGLKESKKQDHKFKDKCDICDRYDFCKGHNGKVLCESCLMRETSQVDIVEGQMTIFDFIGGNYESKKNFFISKSS